MSTKIFLALVFWHTVGYYTGFMYVPLRDTHPGSTVPLIFFGISIIFMVLMHFTSEYMEKASGNRV